MKDSILIYSGGIDSTTMLYEYQSRIALAVSFDYGSNHNKKEIHYARYHTKKLNINHLIIPLNFIHQYFESSLLKGSIAIPEGKYENQNMISTVVPFRNGIMLSIAAGLAESNKLKYIMIANHSGDHEIYPDCRPNFISNLNKAIKNGTYANIKLYAPYTYIKKSEIISRGAKLGIDYSKTWSCYKGEKIHCGKCSTCIERKEAFNKANIKDKTKYNS